jgi:hypothetical protein
MHQEEALNPKTSTCRRAFERHVSRLAYLRVQLCARAIQLSYKCHLARRITRRLRDLKVLLPRIIEQQRQHRGASVLQGAFLCHVARSSMRARAAQVASSVAKRLVARNAYSATLAAMRLQSGVRMLSIHERLRRKFARETICSRARGRHINRLYAEKLARDSITCAVRMAWMHRRYVSNFESKAMCHTCTKAFMRAFIRQWVVWLACSSVDVRMHACTCINSSFYRSSLPLATHHRHPTIYTCRYRKHVFAARIVAVIARLLPRSAWVVRRRASTRLQSAWRGHLDRAWVASEMENLQYDPSTLNSKP